VDVGVGIGSTGIGVGSGVGSGVGIGIGIVPLDVSLDGIVSLPGTMGIDSFIYLLPRYVVFKADCDKDRTIVLIEFTLS